MNTSWLNEIRSLHHDSSPQLRQSAGCSPTAQVLHRRESEQPFGEPPFRSPTSRWLHGTTDGIRASIMRSSSNSALYTQFLHFYKKAMDSCLSAKKMPYAAQRHRSALQHRKTASIEDALEKRKLAQNARNAPARRTTHARPPGAGACCAHVARMLVRRQ